MDRFYAHTKSDPDGTPCPQDEWEPLFSSTCLALQGETCCDCENLEPKHGHINKVAWLTGKFAAELFSSGSAEAEAAKSWGELAGWWHDLGKFSVEFQERLSGVREQANHSSAGAVHAFSAIPGIGQLFAFLIAGHHAGLADWLGPDRAALFRRLDDEKLPQWQHHTPEKLLQRPLPKRLANLNPKNGPAIALFTRLLFSCLVDADFIATEAFMKTRQGARRPNWPDDILQQMEVALETKNQSFGEPTTPVNRQRASVRTDCLAAADRAPGLFTLTVPTGGGKTLSSLAFALRHAITHGLRRVIYVIPYTSIIEQNAGEFRRAFADLISNLPVELRESLVLEHHSNFESTDDEKSERPVCRLAAENWDAPLVVTTSVQFFESLYANKTSRSRKLHNIARSVVILDEAQNLPVNLLAPCLSALRNLQSIAGCSIVFCTATQPAIGTRPRRDDPFNRIALNLPPERELIRDVPKLFNALRRVSTPSKPESLSDDALVERLRQHRRVLCILNSKPHAAKILELLGSQSEENLHLSAQLCPEHRLAILETIKSRESKDESCRLIATTVVEAGVNIDFPVVFRALTGLDSFAQAVGRCNRHGKLVDATGKAILGETVFFEPTDTKTPSFIKQAINATRQILPDHNDPLGPDAIHRFFEIYYWLNGGSEGKNWDKADILSCFETAESERQHPFGFSFHTAAKAFRLIDDFQTPVIIEPVANLWPGQDNKKSTEICQLLEEIRESHRRHYPAPRNAHRRLQRYTVQIPKKIHDRLCREGAIQIYHDQFPILTHPKDSYDPKIGLKTNSGSSDFDAFLL